MPDPEDRDRWVREFRDRSAADLLEKYREPEALSELALNVLRDELKLRGLDPDSLQMTVPRARPEEKGDEIHGETEPPPDLDLPELRSETAVPSDLSTNLRVCPSCRTPNHPEDPVCRNCGAALGGRSEGLEGFSEEGDTTGGGVAPSRVASDVSLAAATMGLVGFAAIVVSIYCAVGLISPGAGADDPPESPQTLAWIVSAIAFTVGALGIGASIATRRRLARPAPERIRS